MAIEGPLRELGIHDVFQLLDLSRKTGALTVTSALRDNQGTVYFDRGGVIHAAVRSNPYPLGEHLVRAGKATEADLERARALRATADGGRTLGEALVTLGAISRRELERQVRFLVEEVVFEVMSWREGYFSFEERDVVDAPVEAPIRISTESLLMEGARRIDEWSRIEGKVPHLGVVPVLATVEEDHPALLDLLPNEWEVLSEIDGARNLRLVASTLARSEFDVAKIVYGLVTTGVVELHVPEREADGGSAAADAAAPYLERAANALARGDTEEALADAGRAVALDPQSAETRLVLARVLSRLARHDEAAEELRRALQLDALNATVHLELGYCAAWRGDYLEAAGSWERYLRMAPNAINAPRVRAAADAAIRLRGMLTEHADG
jgi:hypothetical protein